YRFKSCREHYGVYDGKAITRKMTLSRAAKPFILTLDNVLTSQKTKCDDLLLITDHDKAQLLENGKTINIIPAHTWLTERD
ncbi:MAG: hypothetical protein MJ052_02205, partial [Sphaerochaetaceae bacterium]|nr:hypothetical protein [Sphaerochaetaceae bacterium]